MAVRAFHTEGVYVIGLENLSELRYRYRASAYNGNGLDYVERGRTLNLVFSRNESLGQEQRFSEKADNFKAFAF